MRVLLVLLFAAAGYAQTIRVSPAVTVSNGVTDPAHCVAGREMFINRSSTPVLKLCTATDTWSLVSAGTSSANYRVTFTSQTSVALAHNAASSATLFQCYDNQSPAHAILPDTAVQTDTNTTTVTFSPAQSGSCVVNLSGGGGGGGGGSGTVTSVELTAPSEISVSGSPITSSGTLALSWANQTQAKVLASPASSTGAPAFRALVTGDLPVVAIAQGGTGQSSASAARVALLPSLSGNGSKCLAANSGATDVEFITCASGGGGGTVDGTSLLGSGTEGDPLRVNPATVPTRITGTASLSMSTFGSSSCEEGNITVSGAAVGDEVMIGAPTGLGMGLTWVGYVSSSNTVTLRVCRISGSATISAQTFRATIIRSF